MKNAEHSSFVFTKMSMSAFDARSLSIESTSRVHCVEIGPQAYRFTIPHLLILMPGLEDIEKIQGSQRRRD